MVLSEQGRDHAFAFSVHFCKAGPGRYGWVQFGSSMALRKWYEYSKANPKREGLSRIQGIPGNRALPLGCLRTPLAVQVGHLKSGTHRCGGERFRAAQCAGPREGHAD